MEIDKTTYYDLSILNHEQDYSILHRLDFCKSHGGSLQLQYLLTHPHNGIEQITATQQAIRQLMDVMDEWPTQISNGTLLMIEKFYAYHFDAIPNTHAPFQAVSYRIFSNPDYTLAKYSFNHFCDFLQGMHILSQLLKKNSTPLINAVIERVDAQLKKQILQQIIASKGEKLNDATILRYTYFLYHHLKQALTVLMEAYHTLDAYCSMAIAVKKWNLQFPKLLEQETPTIRAKQLYHLLLQHPVAYDVDMLPENNFIFLTGANMAGKSTFIKSVGVAVYLAHVGMGVPAAAMELSLFDGLLSNIQVQDNLVKGESYFFNEVQRIKNTVVKISDGKKWLVLIDELFKGTNIQDAMQCSLAVIKGLLKIKNATFILSTHLYEIASDLKDYPNIAFRYFETGIHNETLHFTYQLSEGISNDRIGYLILKKEKVIDLLDRL
ncbi:MAG: DNA mismatch repair protein MutS [Bacteroidetes bacterium]|nr:DNA mismatch repair protein MutS [Bacteroidota bacterium]